MTNLKHVLSVGLAATTLAVVLPFLQGVVLLVWPGFVSWVTDAGLTPILGAWFGPVVPLVALALATGTFVVSWNHRSFLVAGLLAAGGVIFMVTSMIATQFFAVIVLPGPILGVIFGLAIFGLGLAKGIRTANAVTRTLNNFSGDNR
jgi:hypothetical protein